MTRRERFLRVLHGQKPDRVPNMEFGYWDTALKAWKGHGLPAGLETDEDLERCLGLEGVSIFPRVPLKNGLLPEFRRLEPLSRRGRYIPTVDPRVPPDVTLDNYFYDPDRKKNIL